RGPVRLSARGPSRARRGGRHGRWRRGGLAVRRGRTTGRGTRIRPVRSGCRRSWAGSLDGLEGEGFESGEAGLEEVRPQGPDDRLGVKVGASAGEVETVGRAGGMDLVGEDDGGVQWAG